MRVERPVTPLSSWANGAFIALVVTAALCVVAVSSGWAGMQIEETCGLEHGQHFDVDHWVAHASQTRWPFSSPCNAEHDMVPSWVNPAIAVTALTSVVCAGVLLVRSAVAAGRWVRGRAGR